MGLKFSVLLSGRLPTEYCHGNVVGAAQITLHLFLQIGKRIEAQIVIETLLIVSVAPFNLAVVPRCSRSEDMVMNVAAAAKHIERMQTLRLCRMREFRTAVCLYFRRCISEPNNRSFYEINRRIARLLLIRINEPFS